MHITLFDGFTNDTVTGFEKGAMIAVLVVAVVGLLYAWMLTRQIMAKPTGNEKMQKIAKAIRMAAMPILSGSSKPYFC